MVKWGFSYSDLKIMEITDFKKFSRMYNKELEARKKAEEVEAGGGAPPPAAQNGSG